MRSVPLSKFIPVLLAAATLTGPARACLNGHDLRGPFKAPQRPGERAIADAPPLGAPKIELSLPGLAPQVAAPGASVAEAAALEAYGLYATEFERARMSPLNRTFGRRIDYTVALIRLGRVGEAIVELEALEQAFPGQYATAANLGTAYELAGRNAEALAWITRGIERNPGSHQGTEWLHVAILRAKLQLEADPSWLARHSVLDEAEPRPAVDVLLAIEYQLDERLVFVRPEDAVVCDLFYQAASRLDATQPGLAERRAHYLRASLRFGAWRKAEVERAQQG